MTRGKKSIVLDINLSYVCNLRCKFCMTKDLRENSNYFFSLDFIISNLKDKLDNIINKYNIEKIILLGGEPTILPYIIEVISFLSNYCTWIGINTNGIKLSDKKFLEKLYNSGLKFVNLSIHHYDDAIIDFLIDAKGVGAKQKKALINIKAIGLDVSLNCVIQQSNYNVLDKYFFYFYKNFLIKSVGFTFIQLNGYALDNLKELIIDYSKLNLRKYIKLFRYFSKIDKTIVVKFSEIPFCVANINIKDYIDFCIDREYYLKGRIGFREDTNGFIFELQSNIRNSVKIKDNFCKNCFLNKNCEGFWKGNYIYLRKDIEYLRNHL